jgi:hypothetical protein
MANVYAPQTRFCYMSNFSDFIDMLVERVEIIYGGKAAEPRYLKSSLTGANTSMTSAGPLRQRAE